MTELQGMHIYVNLQIELVAENMEQTFSMPEQISRKIPRNRKGIRRREKGNAWRRRATRTDAELARDPLYCTMIENAGFCSVEKLKGIFGERLKPLLERLIDERRAHTTGYWVRLNDTELERNHKAIEARMAQMLRRPLFDHNPYMARLRDHSEDKRA